MKKGGRLLVVDLCPEKNSLWRKEFVRPIVDIVKIVDGVVFDVVHFSEEVDFGLYGKVILSGSPLGDFVAFEGIFDGLFDWLKDFKGDVLGICAGAQIIGKMFGCDVLEGSEIGLIDLKVLVEDRIFDNVDLSEVYCLHQSYVEIGNSSCFDVLAQSSDCVEAFKLKDDAVKDFGGGRVYGVLFHPEVRNKKFIENFVNL